jgi:diaminohydroxyphosphoribosylaminopyrimidine deaminase/5-amino-6-(5-phosphoribosylamino)uracil reductase
VSNPQCRSLVFKERARSDAVIVGGNTVRKDGPQLTTRMDHGHAPIRVVLTRSMDLPYDAPLWDTTVAPTMVITQVGALTNLSTQPEPLTLVLTRSMDLPYDRWAATRWNPHAFSLTRLSLRAPSSNSLPASPRQVGANPELKVYLRGKGVEVVELPFLSPQGATEYLTMRGCLQLFWECGGILAAPAVQCGVIHKVTGLPPDATAVQRRKSREIATLALSGGRSLTRPFRRFPSP